MFNIFKAYEKATAEFNFKRNATDSKLIALPNELKYKIIKYAYFIDKESIKSLNLASKHLFWSTKSIAEIDKKNLDNIRKLITELAQIVQKGDNAARYEELCEKIMKAKSEAGILNEGISSYESNLNLSNLDLSGLDLSLLCFKGISFINSNLKNINLSNTSLDRCDFTNANLENANLSEAKMRGQGTTLTKANFKGANVYNLLIEKEAKYFSLTELTWIPLSYGSECKSYEEIVARLSELNAIHAEQTISCPQSDYCTIKNRF